MAGKSSTAAKRERDIGSAAFDPINAENRNEVYRHDMVEHGFHFDQLWYFQRYDFGTG